MIRVLICDDQAIVCDGLEAILSTDPEIQVVGLASDGAQAIEMALALRPDLVLMDLKMPGVNGIQATHAIREQLPDTRVLVLTTYDADEWVFDAIRSGAAGYMLKDTPRSKLIPAIKDTVQGKTHVDPAVAGKLFNRIAQDSMGQVPSTLAHELSDREREILQLIASGLSNVEIAERLHLSDGTVRNYVSALLGKLGVADRTQAAVLALRYGLVD
ncbi:MAG TPA: response regulator transcription factor [Aggregatilinea sp.]|jgi:DNA-binding NarL/FixJ family response regulator|uniref:response regulator transcription factor n=1 Tax=Aggregatilinea sp. TaxID=2806333 RepID=UPI002C78C425|nr:response regulator transcription factor [Aggregatilinea sp.]HML20570.1 response regulator transcription factor [Aggregatilinea sp.]